MNEGKFIKPVGGGKFVVVSRTGKRMSRPLSKAKAQKRLRQVEWFKHHGGKTMGVQESLRRAQEILADGASAVEEEGACGCCDACDDACDAAASAADMAKDIADDMPDASGAKLCRDLAKAARDCGAACKAHGCTDSTQCAAACECDAVICDAAATLCDNGVA